MVETMKQHQKKYYGSLLRNWVECPTVCCDPISQSRELAELRTGNVLQLAATGEFAVFAILLLIVAIAVVLERFGSSDLSSNDLVGMVHL